MFNIYSKLPWFKNGHRKFIFSPYFRHLFPCSTSVTEEKPPKNSFMADYLINSCGFSREKAISVSADLSHLNNPEKPDSVINFMKQFGFNDTHIRTLITWKPNLLSTNVERTLKPRLKVFQDLGMTGPAIVELVIANYTILYRSVESYLLRSIEFLRTHLHSDEDVIKVLNKYSRLLSFDLHRTMLPNITFLEKCGVSNKKISKMILINPRFMMQKPNWLEEIAERVEKLGVARNSSMFFYAVFAISTVNKSRLGAKFEFFKSFGWSETDLLYAFRKYPGIIKFSENKIQQSMNFFLNELECDPSYIALFPTLLSYSLENRIIPRHSVLQILKSKNLLKRNLSPFTMACRSEKRFFDQYVLRYKDQAPEVCDAYAESSKKGVSSLKC